MFRFSNPLRALAILALGLCPQPLAAQIPADIVGNVVLLTSKLEPGCASGFVIDGGLVVANAHLVDSLCQDRRCTGLKIFRSSAEGARASEAVPVEAVKIEAVSYSLDVAFLRISPPLGPHSPLKFANSVPSSGKVTVFSFSRCAELARSEGEIKSLNELRVSLTAVGGHGSSGGPVLDANGQVIGVVDEAASVTQSLWAWLSDGRSELRAVRSDLSFKVLGSGAKGEVLRAIRDYYWSTVVKADGGKRVNFARAMAGYDLLATTNGLARDLLDDQQLKDIGALLGQPVPVLAQRASAFPKDSPEGILWEILFMRAVEEHGPYSSVLNPLNENLIISSLNQGGLSTEAIDSLIAPIRSAAQISYPGAEFSLIRCVVTPLVLGSGLLILWLWSLGYTFAKSKGSLLRRFGIMLLVAFLIWPLSFALFVRKTRG